MENSLKPDPHNYARVSPSDISVILLQNVTKVLQIDNLNGTRVRLALNITKLQKLIFTRVKQN